MKYPIFVVALLMLCSLAIVQAQQDSVSQYHLREPSAKDYLSALPDIVEQLKANTTPDKYGINKDSDAMLQVIRQEIVAKYKDLKNIPFKVLEDADPYVSPTTYSYSVISESVWNQWKILAALAENKTLLSTKNKFQIENYTFEVTKIDFNGDGVNELLLNIQSEGDLYKDYWVLKADPTAPLGYKRVKTPDLWFSENCDFRQVCGGAGQILELRDLNGDSLPEWAIAVGSYCGYGECGGHLLVLSWRNDAIVELTRTEDFWDLGWTHESGGGRSPLLPPDGSWTFENIDQDAALELVQRIPFTDNRGCKIIDNRVFDWSPETQMYVRSKLNRTYADDIACTLRLGEEAMRVGDYQSAIAAYERAGRLFDSEKPPDDYAREAAQYAQIRLMIAYALANQPDEALAVQIQLKKQKSQSDIMQSLLNAVSVYHSKDDKIQLCSAINTAVAEHIQTNTDENFPIFATTDNVEGRSSMYGGGDFSPNTAGCDVSLILKQSGTKVSRRANTSFLQGIRDEGWTVRTSFKADLNNDGLTDWLIWTEEVNQAVLFMSSETGYKVSLEYVTEPDSETQLTIHHLIGHENPLLVILDYRKSEDNNYDSCGDNKQIGSIDLRQWNGENFRYVGNSTLCERRTLDQLFPMPDVLQAWGSANNFSGGKIETTYQWNSIKKQFEVSSQVDFIPSIQDFNKFDCYGQPYSYCGFQYDVKTEIVILAQVLAQRSKWISPNLLMMMRYSRALDLEALDKPNEALKEYVAIYNSTPDSAWGKLAVLHLECVANCAS